MVTRSRMKRSGAGAKKKNRLKRVEIKVPPMDKLVETTTEYAQPNRNFEEFKKDVKENIQRELLDKVKSGEIKTQEEFDEKVSWLKGLHEELVEDPEPSATVQFHNYGESEMGDETPHNISTYRDETDGEFDVKWHSTSAWRGYYEVSSKDWVNVHSDVALSYSADAEELRKFNDEFKETLDAQNIPYATVVSRTSNVFSAGYDLFVKKQDEGRVKEIVKNLVEKYRDPERFERTALTGTSEKTPEGEALVKASRMLKAGVPFEEVKKKILKKK